MPNGTGSTGRIRWPLALGLGLAGLGLNAVPVEVLSGVHLLPGHLAVIAAGVFLGPWAAMVAGAVAGSITPGQFGHFWVWPMFVLEGGGVGLLARRFRPLGATGLYWALAGGPYLGGLLGIYPFGTAATIVVKTVVESSIGALVLQVLALVPRVHRALGAWLPPPLREVRTQVVVRSVVLLAALLPLVVLAASNARLLYRQRVIAFDRANQVSVMAIGKTIEARIRDARIAVDEAAHQVEGRSRGVRRILSRSLIENPLLREAAVVEDGRPVSVVGVPREDGASLRSFDRIPPGPPVRELEAGEGRPPLLLVATPTANGEIVAGVDPALFLQSLPIRNPADTRVLVLDREGRLLADSGVGPVDEQLRSAIDRAGAEGSAVFLENPSAPRTLRPQATTRVAVASVAPFGLRVAVARQQRSLQPTVEAEAMALLGGFVVAMLVVFVLGLALTRLMVDPVRAVSRAAAHLEAGRRAARVESGADGAPVELRELAEDFDRMAERLEQQLGAIEAASRAKDEFLSVASHELKTPLTILKAQVQLLERRAADVHGPQLKLIDRQLDRITRLVSQLLDASAVGAGVISLEPRECELSAVVRRVAEGLAPSAPAHELRLDLREVTGRWDELRLEQVFHNLIGNAIKYSPAGGPIDVSVVALPDGGAEVVVADRGVGLTASTKAKLFERFGRGEAPSNIGGFGVGLYVVRAIVQRHGGTVDLSPRDGGGAVATVRLPKEAPAALPLPRPRAGAEETARE